MGCSGLMAKLAAAGSRIHVVYLAVDGFHHYGVDGETTYAERVAEIEDVLALFGEQTTYEIAYGDQDLIEQLDTLPRRDLVDRFEKVIIERQPDLLLLPALPDYDQDHQAVFYAAHAAARPIAQQFGNWLTPNVLAYEMTKIQWAAEPLPRFGAFWISPSTWRPSSSPSAAIGRCFARVPISEVSSRSRPWRRIRGAEIGVTYAEAFAVLRTTL